jgi:hypothetical protein
LPLFDELRQILPEEKYPKPIITPDLFEFEYENYKIGKDILGELILDEIMLYNIPAAREYYLELKREYPFGALEQTYNSSKSTQKPS